MQNYKHTVKCLLVIFVAVFSEGCSKDWLDAKSNKNQTVASSLTDYQDLMDMTYQANSFEPSLGEVGSDGHYITENAWSHATYANAKNAYTWSDNTPYSKVHAWDDTYTNVFGFDLVLDGLQKTSISSAADQQDWNNIEGQALFQRAYAFYDLAQIWAPPYDSTSSEKDLGIPLRLTSDITVPSTRASVKQTYDQIIGDVQKAGTLLPQKALYLSRPSLTAVDAFLARIYLCVGNYDSAYAYSNKCLSAYNTLIDYNTLDSTANSVGFFNQEVIFQIVMYTGTLSGFITTNCLIDTALYNSYNTNDLRRAVFFSVNADNTIKYKGNYNNTSTSSLFCGLATDEMYLVRAECSARLGNTTDAMNDLNTLLQTRWRTGTFVPYTAVNSTDALNQILTERKKELLLRGLRWSDLRRLNKDDRFKIILTRVIGGNTYTLNPNTYQYTFPIPIDVIQTSSLQQNPGW